MRLIDADAMLKRNKNSIFDKRGRHPCIKKIEKLEKQLRGE